VGFLWGAPQKNNPHISPALRRFLKSPDIKLGRGRFVVNVLIRERSLKRRRASEIHK
jgi:hypothetical protein